MLSPSLWSSGLPEDLTSILEEEIEMKPSLFDEPEHVDAAGGSDDGRSTAPAINYDDITFTGQQFDAFNKGMSSEQSSATAWIENEVSINSCWNAAKNVVDGTNVQEEEETEYYPTSEANHRRSLLTRRGGRWKPADIKPRNMFQNIKNEQQWQQHQLQPVDEEVPKAAAGHHLLVAARPLSLDLDTISCSSLLTPQVTPQQVEKNKRNAQIAKQNREKKKLQFRELEEENSELKAAMQHLMHQRQVDARKIQDLENDVGYYRDVLESQSEIAEYLENFTRNEGKKPDVQLGNRVMRKRHSSIASDHDYDLPPKRGSRSQPKSSGGVCMHISKGGRNNNAKVVLETCRACAEHAAK